MNQQGAEQSPAVVLYAIEGLVLLLLFAFAALGARAVRRPMPWRHWFPVLEILLAGGLFAGVWVVTGIRAAMAALYIAACVGAIVGAIPAAAAKPFAAARRLVLARSGLSWFFVIFAYGLLGASAFFAPKPFMSAALVMVATANGALAGDLVVRTARGIRWSRTVGAIPMAPPYVSAPTGGLPTGADAAVAGEGAASAAGPLAVRPGWARSLAEDIAMPATERRRRAKRGASRPRKERGKLGERQRTQDPPGASRREASDA